MIMPFAYLKPRALDEALQALGTNDARPLAGGTALLVDMRNGLDRPGLLVDVKGLGELDGLSIVPEKGVTIGARMALNALLADRKLSQYCPVLSQAASQTATHHLRNRATLVGNICRASPAADMAPPLYILGAEVVIAGPEGERGLPISRFITGAQSNALKKGELVVRVEIPPVPKAKMAFLKKQRIKGHDLALVNVAGLADASAGILKLCVGACAQTPVLLEGTDQLYGETQDIERLADRVADLALSAISPIDDVRASAEYRRDMVRVFVKRIVKRICS